MRDIVGERESMSSLGGCACQRPYPLLNLASQPDTGFLINRELSRPLMNASVKNSNAEGMATPSHYAATRLGITTFRKERQQKQCLN